MMILMDDRLPLPDLLSQALVAFIVEFDNEFEHRTPHRTTNQPTTAGLRHVPWLVSRVMWSRFMQFVEPEGGPVGALQKRMRASREEMDFCLKRMGAWWRYIDVAQESSTPRSRASFANAIVRPTSGGGKAIEEWRPLDALIEQRWEQRFGAPALDRLKTSLREAAVRLQVESCSSLPVLGYGLTSDGLAPAPVKPSDRAHRPALESLPVLLSSVLLAFANEFERQSDVSLAICANVLRFAGDRDVPAADLPRLAGISKEAIAMALSFLKARGLASLSLDGSKRRVLKLTAKGKRACQTYRERVQAIEGRWTAVLGQEAFAALLDSLEVLVCGPSGSPSPLFLGLEPYPDGWRAELPRPEHLPHFPMILHRGGFPDGS
ncbi:MAG: hypothetical protein ABR976_15660 [Terracidiphilus sp.]|jgi:DNA-binding MarR family transcriptional regulator